MPWYPANRAVPLVSCEGVWPALRAVAPAFSLDRSSPALPQLPREIFRLGWPSAAPPYLPGSSTPRDIGSTGEPREHPAKARPDWGCGRFGTGSILAPGWIRSVDTVSRTESNSCTQWRPHPRPWWLRDQAWNSPAPRG